MFLRSNRLNPNLVLKLANKCNSNMQVSVTGSTYFLSICHKLPWKQTCTRRIGEAWFSHQISTIQFSRTLLPRSVETRPIRLRWCENALERHSFLSFLCGKYLTYFKQNTTGCIWPMARKRTFSFQKKKEFSQRFTTLGRLAHTPRAGTGDSACKSRHYWCSFVCICQGNLSICGTFLIRLLPLPDNCGYQPKRARFLVVYVFFLDS